MKRICENCSIEFDVTSKHLKKRFCTQECWRKYQTAHKLNMKETSRNRPTLEAVKLSFAKQREDIIKSLSFISDILSGIYIIINIENNMFYVGSAQNIEVRWKEHINKLYCNRHENDKLQKAWNKYGDKAFQFKILEATEIIKLIEREQHYLDLYKPYERNIGYNIYKTAYSPLGTKRTLEQIQAMSIARKGRIGPMTGRKHSSEAKEAMKKSQAERYAKLRAEGKLPQQTGSFKWSEEDKKKMSETRKGKIHSKEYGEVIRQRRLGSRKVNGHMVYPGDPNYPK